MPNDRKTLLNREYLKVPKCINVLIVGHLKQCLFFTRTIGPIVFDKLEHVWPKNRDIWMYDEYDINSLV